MVKNYLDFEKTVQELDKDLENAKKLSFESGAKDNEEYIRLRKKLRKLQKEMGKSLNPWQVVQMARHPDRPYSLDYFNLMLENFCELHGDRLFSDDPAIVAGIGIMKGVRVCVIGHQKGRDTRQKIHRNFGMPNPEGYRKALRVMKFAEKFNIPIITLIDTPGAYPGVGAEERGQAQAIAVNLKEMMLLKVPIVSVVTGEGGSGGALAVAVADRVLMLENSIYSVISPEACATILLKDSTKAATVAEPLKMLAEEAKKLGVVHETVPEPLGGAHRDYVRMAAILRSRLMDNLSDIKKLSVEEMLENRYNNFRSMGRFDLIAS